MEPALNIMVDVRAYLQVAYKRFADIVPLAIDRELVRGPALDVFRVIYTVLKINGPEGSPQWADKRVDLKKKLDASKLRKMNYFQQDVAFVSPST